MLQEPLKPGDTADAPFRARLRARDGMRPQSTLAILAGYEPKEMAAAEIAPRPRAPRPAPVAVAPVTTAKLVAPVAAAAPAPRRIEPASRPDAWAPPARPQPVRPREEVRRAPAVIIPPVEEDIDTAEETAEEERRETVLGRFGEYSQLAFAGLAVLGLAGLSLLAIDNTLKGKPGLMPEEGDDTVRRASADPGAAVGPASVSAVAVQEVATPAGSAPQPWFDYSGVADYLKSRVEAHQAAEREAARLQQEEAQRLAAAAIADAEAERLATAARAEADALATRDAAIEAERQRLAREEAERIANEEAQRLAAQAAADAAAKAEADRLAKLEAERAAAALVEQRRLAELEVQRAAEAEAQRVAELEARRIAAEAEAKRLAELEAKKAAAAAEEKRLADIAAKRAADEEAARLAALDAKRAADAAEARRLADLEAKRLADAEARKLAEASKPVVLASAATAPAAPIVPPRAASLKPARPDVQPLVSADPVPVTRTAPTILTAGAPEVRPFVVGPANALRGADVFLGERVALTAGAAINADEMSGLQQQFVRLVGASPDATLHRLSTPDGRQVEVTFERTQLVGTAQANLRTVGYSADASAPIARAYAEQPAVNVSVMCRDVAYAIPGQERGRFSACQGADGHWMLARTATSTASAGPV